MLAQTMGFESNKEYNEIMFLREITHTVNALNDMGDIVRLYSKNPTRKKHFTSSDCRYRKEKRLWQKVL